MFRPARSRFAALIGPGGIAVAALLVVSAVPAAGQNPEFRSMWSSRFDWPHTDPNTCRGKIDTLMTNLQSTHFNAVLFQVRGQCDTLYPSPYETWSPLLGETDPGWDPLAYAVNAAHTRGIELHAYINAHTCWQSNPASARELPDDLNHVFYDHCNLDDPAHRDWLHYISADSPVQFSENDYVWIAPGVPSYQAWWRQQVLYVVNTYDVDGVHYDRIRTPWSNEPSYDPISLARFNDAQSNPENLDFTAWTADQITRMVCDTTAAILAARPEVKVSAAVYSNPATAPTAQHQDALEWAERGAMDMLVPMMYFAGGAGSSWDTRLQTWLAGSSGRHVVAGHITSQGVTSLLEQVALTRTRGGQGNAVFSSGSFTFWSNYLSSVYQVAVPVPTMPWKTSPSFGVIVGTVTSPGGTPVVDAQVTRNGTDYVALSSGDGFYSFLLVPPGTYTLDAAHPSYGPASASGVVVAAGGVTQRNLVLGPPQPPVIAEVTPDPDSVVAGHEYARQLTLSAGSADTWTLLAGPSGAQVSSSGLVSGWTPALTDAGQTFNFSVRASNTANFDDESWSVWVAPAPACEPLVIADFEGFDVGTRVLFNNPRFSGSTSDDLAASPDVAQVSDAVPAFGGTNSYLVRWQYIDSGSQRWLRLTTHNGPNKPNPTIPFDRPIRVRLRLDEGRFMLAVGIRETGTTAELGENGGTSGTIEWVGADSDVNGAPQGVPVEPQPGVWQTFVFDPLTMPIHGMTGNGALSSPTDKGTFEQLAFTIVDTVGPFTLYLDDVELLCPLPPFGDMDGDGDLDGEDLLLAVGCLSGPDMPIAGGCDAARADGDQDVDLADVALWQIVFSGL